MSALGRVVRAGVGRKRVQTLVMLLTTMTAVTACVLAAGLLVASQGPFNRAFAQQKGAHLAAEFDPSKVTDAQLAATAHVPGVTKVAGPYPSLTLLPHVGKNHSFLPVGATLAPMTLVGRPINGPLDDLRMTLGHWVTGPGQVVLPDGDSPLALGDTMTFPGLPGRPTLTVVGLASSVSRTADGWVAPTGIATLTAPGTSPAPQMLYRFAHADTNAQVSAYRDALAAAVPPGGMTDASSYLDAKQAADKTAATFVPFVVAFGVLGLCMSVLIIGVVVSGMVTAATRRIGILKSLGFTPTQVVRAYVGQALIPATIGTALGILLGNVLAVPVLGVANEALSTGSTGIPVWIDIAVPALALGAIAATALVPALRAGRLRTVEALTVGRTSYGRSGRTAQRLLVRLPLPRAISLGLAGPFTRPLRSATTAAAVVLGTIGVTFGAGLAISLGDVQDGLNRENAGAVLIQSFMQPGTHPLKHADEAGIAAALTAQPGTRNWFSTGQTRVGVAGKPGQTTVIAYQGASSWGAYQMVSGSWFHGPGEAVVPSSFLSTNGVHVGDTITLTDNVRTAPVRIVGEVLSLHDVILTDGASLAPLDAYIGPESVQYDIDLEPAVNQQTYVNSLNRALARYGLTAMPNSNRVSPTVIAMDTLALMLTLMLVAVAGLGVLNTVLIDTRERVHDLGVLKALGMAPRQTITMVLASVTVSGLAAGLIGVPIGIALHNWILPAMAHAAGTDVPITDVTVYRLPLLACLVLGGLLMAALGALAPATWAARTGTATALRTE